MPQWVGSRYQPPGAVMAATRQPMELNQGSARIASTAAIGHERLWPTWHFRYSSILQSRRVAAEGSNFLEFPAGVLRIDEASLILCLKSEPGNHYEKYVHYHGGNDVTFVGRPRSECKRFADGKKQLFS